MKNPITRTVVLSSLLALVPLAAAGQFKSGLENRPGVSESIMRPGTSDAWLGIFDPSRMSMRHTFSLSYGTFGGGRGMSLGMYTNSLYYKIADPLDVQVDVSLMYSPSSSSMGGPQKDFSGVYITRAQLNYRPSESTLLQINFQQLPMSSWMMGSPYRSPFYDFGLPRAHEDN